MPSPSSSQATLRPDLGGSFEEFGLAMDRAGFIGHRVLPVFETMKQSGPFGIIPVEELLKKRETKRAPGGGYARGDWEFTNGTYSTEEHGAEEPVDDREAEMYADFFAAELVSAEICRDIVMRNAEQRAADLLFNATTWTGASLNTSVSNEWDDAANATPIVDVNAARLKVWESSGLWPNALILNRKVFHNLREVDEIIDRLKYQGFQDVRSSEITAAALSQVFDLEHVLVAGGAKNTADEGQTLSPSQIWSDEYAMVARIARTRSIREPCVGRIFHWGEDGSMIGGTYESYRDETVRSDIIRHRHDVDEKVLLVEAAHLLDNITT